MRPNKEKSESILKKNKKQMMVFLLNNYCSGPTLGAKIIYNVAYNVQLMKEVV